MNIKFFKKQTLLVQSILLSIACANAPAFADTTPKLKEWTFLVFLNGNNSLDAFGADDINEMEQVGSNNDINVVVQWASYARKDVYRLLVEKDTKPSEVTSKVVKNMGAVDMGDWNNLVDFVSWAQKNYPAKHYFIDVWNHGNGWHMKNPSARAMSIRPMDISYDDKTGNMITTEQLAQALAESAKIIGHKVDIYGSDACLMAMVEVATQMKDSVAFSVGSEETEPGEGWAYGEFLAAWAALGTNSTPERVASELVRTYKASYQNGSQGNQEITISAFDLSKVDALNASIKNLSSSLNQILRTDRGTVKKAAEASLAFTLSDYVDLADFSAQLESQHSGVDSQLIQALKASMSAFVISNQTTSSFSRAGGVSMWIPTQSYLYNDYSSRYSNLDFAKQTGWDTVLESLNK